MTGGPKKGLPLKSITIGELDRPARIQARINAIHDDHVILFDDRAEKAEIVGEADILGGKPEKRAIDTSKPYHGVAVTIGNKVLVSVQRSR